MPKPLEKNPSHKGSIWYNNPETGKSIRIYYGDEIPEGYVRGRFLFPNYPFIGNRLNAEQLAKHREYMKPYYWLYRKNKDKHKGKK